MVFKVQEIINLIENFAPLETQARWDNSGWQVNLGKETCSKIMTALTVTEEVICQAEKKGCDLILSHHPLIFEPLKKIESKIIINTIQKGIQIYSAHTNLDLAPGGTTDVLAEKCGFKDGYIICEFIKAFNLDKEEDIESLQNQIKEKLSLDCLKAVNFCNKKKIKTVAFCAGAGGSEIKEVNQYGIDLYITGDVKYHDALEATNLAVFDIGHFHGEQYTGEIFRKILGEKFEIVNAEETRPYYFV